MDQFEQLIVAILAEICSSMAQPTWRLDVLHRLCGLLCVLHRLCGLLGGLLGGLVDMDDCRLCGGSSTYCTQERLSQLLQLQIRAELPGASCSPVSTTCTPLS